VIAPCAGCLQTVIGKSLRATGRVQFVFLDR